MCQISDYYCVFCNGTGLRLAVVLCSDVGFKCFVDLESVVEEPFGKQETLLSVRCICEVCHFRLKNDRCFWPEFDEKSKNNAIDAIPVVSGTQFVKSDSITKEMKEDAHRAVTIAITQAFDAKTTKSS